MEEKKTLNKDEAEATEPKLPEEELDKVSGGGIIIRPTGGKPSDGDNLL